MPHAMPPLHPSTDVNSDAATPAAPEAETIATTTTTTTTAAQLANSANSTPSSSTTASSPEYTDATAIATVPAFVQASAATTADTNVAVAAAAAAFAVHMQSQTQSGGGNQRVRNMNADFAAPPPYDENDYKLPLALAQGKLPTYEEVQQEKIANGAITGDSTSDGAALAATAAAEAATARASGPPPMYHQLQMHSDGTATALHCPPGMRTIVIHPSSTAAALPSGGGGSVTATAGSDETGSNDAVDPESLMVSDDSLLGTDLMFLAAFLLTFLFNWMGFLLITCACHNIAARYGSLSGFGLSLAKWTMIMKNSSTALGADENSWLWWLIMGFGFLICVRAAVQYVSIKRSWRRLTVASAERMLVYDN